MIVDALVDSYHRTCEMWMEEVTNIPDAEWRRGDINYLVPARHLCHMIEVGYFYFSGQTADEFEWGKIFDGDWESSDPSSLPDKAAAIKMLSEFSDFIKGKLNDLNEEKLAAEETKCTWTGPTMLHKLLYLLRHCQHHVGELHSELRRRGIDRAQWK